MTASSPARALRSLHVQRDRDRHQGDRRRGERRRQRSSGASGDRLRTVQTGYVRNYALGIVGGLVVLVAYFLIRAKG